MSRTFAIEIASGYKKLHHITQGPIKSSLDHESVSSVFTLQRFPGQCPSVGTHTIP